MPLVRIDLIQGMSSDYRHVGRWQNESAAEVGPELILVGEDSRTAILRLAEPGSSVTVKNKNGQIEYAG